LVSPRRITRALIALVAVGGLLPAVAHSDHYPVRRFSPGYNRLAQELSRAGIAFGSPAGLKADEVEALSRRLRTLRAPRTTAAAADAGSGVSIAGSPAFGALAFAGPIGQAIDAGAYRMTLADFDRDGVPDVAVSTTDGLRILRGLGDGRLENSIAIPVAAARTVAEDFDLDGWIDLVDARGHVFLNRHDGTFAVDSFPMPEGHIVLAGDLDSRPGRDLVVIRNGFDHTVVMPLSNDGAGAFARGRPLLNAGVTTSATLVDLNADARADLVLGQRQSVAVLLGGSGGSWGPPTNYAVARGALELVAADLDGDGDIDLASAGDIEEGDAVLSILTNSGDGTFGPADDRAVGDRDAWGVAAGDLDQDGRVDLIATTIGLTGSPTVGPHDWLRVFWNGPAGLAAPTRLTGPAEFRVATQIELADMNGDGMLDVVTLENVNASLYFDQVASVSVILGHGDRTFDAIACFDDVGPAAYYYWGDLRSGRFRDGQRDLVAARQNALCVFPNRGSGQFDPAQPIGVGAIGAALDLNADGYGDLVTANLDTVSILLAVGDGSFTRTESFPGHVFLGTGAMSGTRLPDIATLDGQSRLVVLRNVGSGSFREMPADAWVLPPDASAVAVADLDGDGRADLAVARAVSPVEGSDSLGVWLQGSGSFEPAGTYAVGYRFCEDPTVDCQGFAHPSDLQVGDFDGDGDLDLALSESAIDVAGSISVLRNDGTGHFGQIVNRLTEGKDAIALAAADFNMDGMDDLAVLNVNDEFNGGVRLFQATGDFGFDLLPGESTRGTYLVSWAPTAIAAGDVTGDGRADLLVGNSAPAAFSFLRNVTIPGAPTSVAATLISAQAEPGSVRLSWQVNGSAGGRFALERRGSSSSWVARSTVLADPTDRLDARDEDVVPGQRYAYRLVRLGSGGPVQGEFWVRVPRQEPGIALEGVHPNPNPGRQLTVSFSMTRAEPATLELLDVSGRRVRSRTIEPALGAHRVQLNGVEPLPAGLYWVRLSQAGEYLTSKVTVIQ
jgi:hypothetical protein